MPRERTEAETQPTVIWSMMKKALMGDTPPRKMPPKSKGIEKSPSTERLATVGETTAIRARRRKGIRALRWGWPLPRRNSYCSLSALRAVT